MVMRSGETPGMKGRLVALVDRVFRPQVVQPSEQQPVIEDQIGTSPRDALVDLAADPKQEPPPVEEPIDTSPEAVERRRRLFPGSMIQNKLWVHGAKQDGLEGILQKGLMNPNRRLREMGRTDSTSDITLAREVAFADYPRYTGGQSGALIFFHVQDGDLARDTRSNDHVAAVNYEGLPIDRIMFHIPPGNLLLKVDKLVEEAIRTGKHFADVGIADRVTDIQDKINTLGFFPDPAKKTPEMVAQLAREVVWNGIHQRLLGRIRPHYHRLRALWEISRDHSLPTSLDEFNKLMKGYYKYDYYKKMGVNLEIDRDDLLRHLKFMQALPHMEGSGYDGVDVINLGSSTKIPETELTTLIDVISHLTV